MGKSFIGDKSDGGALDRKKLLHKDPDRAKDPEKAWHVRKKNYIKVYWVHIVSVLSLGAELFW